MGLDSVELIVRVEKTFQISIPDKEAEKIVTVGDLYNIVWKYAGKVEGTRCLSQGLRIN
jgi:acyl carrier protein